KGKVTRKIYESKFGEKSLWPEALNHAIGHKFQEALAEPSVTIVSDPTDVDVDFEKISTDKPFEVSFVVAIKPEVTLGQYVGVEVPKVDTEVTEDEIKLEVEALLSEGAQLEP